MKNYKRISISGLTIATIVCAIFAITACGSKQKDASKEGVQLASTETSPKPPDMDIYTAALVGDLDAIRQHISAGTDLNKKDPYGSTALIISSLFGKTEVAKALIDAGADLNIQNNEGSTALHVAAFFCRPDIVRALLDEGADKSIKNNFGSTPLESVSGPFETAKPIYDQLSKDLGPLGLKLDYKYLEETRPKVAEMLK